MASKNGVNVATGYVQIVPTTGDFMPELRQQLSVPIEDEGHKVGGGFMEKFKKGAIAVAAGAGAAIGVAVGKIIKGALGEGADLEQNLGGTEAVFGMFAENLQKTAGQAYKNMGTSASEYMEIANKMGAMFQGSGFSQVQSLNMTREAMQRAADVASVLGLSTEDALTSIAGLAKGNLTMMDNLGVAMNATTLEAYAAEKGMEGFTWSAATNLEKTELAMQMFLDRTQQYEGNFAREASETFAGSMGAMQAALKNVLGNLALGNDVMPSLMDLLSTTSDFLNKNAIPAIKNIVTALPGAIIAILDSAGPSMGETGAELLKAIVLNLPDIISSLGKATCEIVKSLLKTLWDSRGEFISAGLNMMLGLGEGANNAFNSLIDTVRSICSGIIGSIKSFFQIRSPSRLMRDEIGRNIIAGEAMGIEENSDMAIKAVRASAADVSRTFDTELAYDAVTAAGTISDDYTGRDDARQLDIIVDAIRSLGLYIDGDTLVGHIADRMDTALGNNNLLQNRGIA